MNDTAAALEHLRGRNAESKDDHMRAVKAEMIRRRYRRPRKIRLRQYRAARIAQAIAANPKVAPATVKRWTR